EPERAHTGRDREPDVSGEPGDPCGEESGEQALVRRRRLEAAVAAGVEHGGRDDGRPGRPRPEAQRLARAAGPGGAGHDGAHPPADRVGRGTNRGADEPEPHAASCAASSFDTGSQRSAITPAAMPATAAVMSPTAYGQRKPVTANTPATRAATIAARWDSIG